MIRAVQFSQLGACLCRAIEYRLSDDPLTVYACHCTDCQSQTGSSYALTMLVRRDSVEILKGRLEYYSIELADGRLKSAHFCGRCHSRILAPSSGAELAVLEPGTLDDTSWTIPVGHIWTRSAQPWVEFSRDSLCFAKAPGESEVIDLVRAWKQRNASD